MPSTPSLRTSLVRVYPFEALHHYGRADRSEAWNRERFGPHVQPHRHRYRLELTVVGAPDPETGFVVDLPALDAAVARVLEPLDGSDLNETVPAVREEAMQPSTEALAAWFWTRLEGVIPSGARLRRVRVWESGELAGEVEPDAPPS